MPTYEYSCPQCGVVEVFQKITEDALKSCPNCGSDVTRLVSGAAFHLKGSGWYKTDYASKSSGESGKSSSSSSSESKPSEPAPAAETKSEGKPAEKTSAAKSESAKSE